jgi:hypothetical protein
VRPGLSSVSGRRFNPRELLCQLLAFPDTTRTKLTLTRDYCF